MPLHLSVSHSVQGGVCGKGCSALLRGSMHGESGYAWQKEGMCDKGGGVYLAKGGIVTKWAYVEAMCGKGGMCGAHVWLVGYACRTDGH